ncbi:MAG TPA: hypothetical protein VGN11_01045 [Candidatus Baltobacteraceae bacterium]|jgi:outer membrane protein|nr:hypothetical protein [Candidatus Baltobacteraceae bacterium]
MKKYTLVAALAAAMLAGCTGNSSPVGLIDVNRVVANWPVYQNDQQQLLVEEQKIVQSKTSAGQKAREAQALQKKYAGITDDLTKQIRDAANKIATQRNLKLVVTKQGVGYGGVDITADVEKLMNITEKATPSPT